MPGFDGTGPQGRGPMRGDGSGCGNRRGRQKSADGRRCASGYGAGQRSGPTPGDIAGLIEPEPPGEHAALEMQAAALRERLARIEARLASLET